MGNTAASCAPSVLFMSINGGGVKLLHSNGTLQIFTKKAVKAAEVMVDNPGEFVCDYSSLRVGQRIQGLSADQQLQTPHLYLLLPMDLLYSVLTPEEMSLLSAFKANNYKKALSRSIFPVLIGEFCINPSDQIKKTMDTSTSSSSSSSDEQPKPAVDRSFFKQASWKPALQTIVESEFISC